MLTEIAPYVQRLQTEAALDWWQPTCQSLACLQQGARGVKKRREWEERMRGESIEKREENKRGVRRGEREERDREKKKRERER